MKFFYVFRLPRDSFIKVNDLTIDEMKVCVFKLKIYCLIKHILEARVD